LMHRRREGAFRVFVAKEIPREGLDLLESECEVFVAGRGGAPTDPGTLREGARTSDAILTLLTDRVDGEVLEGARARLVANCAAGYDNVDVEAATRLGVAVTNTPGVLTDTTADLTFALILAVARRIPEADRFTRAGGFDGWDPMLLLGHDVHGATLGVVGMGRIGKAVARRARGFDMRVLYASRRAHPEAERESGAVRVDLDELLAESDFVTLHVPLTEKTHHLIGGRELSAMKRSAYLINVSRGPVVDERALVEALREGVIAGAALDVYEDEPRLAEGLTELDNVVLAPHIGSASHRTRSLMARIAAENVVAFKNGRRPPNLVNPEVWRGGTGS